MNESEALEVLEKLISEISRIHCEVSSKWEDYAKCAGLERFNQRSCKVVRLMDSLEMNEYINRYLNFLNDLDERYLFDRLTPDYTVNTRVKAMNSLQEKIKDYCRYRPEKGEVSISKCVNDLFGIRIIHDCPNLKIESIRELKSKYGNQLIIEEKDVPINQSGFGYKAIHLYFHKDNQSFRWELQIWKSIDEKGNMQSHKFHRYKYKNWEKGVGEVGKTLHNSQ